MKQTGIKQIAENRKARHDYFVLETYEAGIALVGTEVKVVRNGGVSLKEAGLDGKVTDFFMSMLAGPGAVRATLHNNI